MAIQDFDATYYLGVKLAALQANPETASEWTSLSTTTELLTALTALGFTAESHYEAFGISEGLYPNQAAADAGTVAGETHYLTTGQDVGMVAGDDFIGGAGDDTYIARGDSSLDNADMIDAGAGTDTMEVMLDSAETAESPLLENFEILKVQAQSTTVASGDNDVDNFAADVEANIDAGDMASISEYWSEDSRADLTIEDVSHNSHLTTVGMRETDPGDVDYNVFFDPENITSPAMAATGGSSLTILAVNSLALAEGENPLTDFESVNFTVDGSLVEVDMSGLTTYSEFVTAITTALAGTGVTVTENTGQVASFGIDFLDVDSSYISGATAGTYSSITLTSTTELLEKGLVEISGDADSNAISNTMTDTPVEPDPSLTQVNVVLDRVGKDSEGGDLLIGSDSTGNSGSDGIQQFNVDVDRSSWLTSISSTNNTLEVINVENVATNNTTADGNLTVNNIVDVRVFDASAMAGDVTLGATLSADVTEKYLDLSDSAADAAADNSELAYANVDDEEFSYDFGAGDDTLALVISSANLEAAGTTNREDFVLEINGGAGDDAIATQIGTGAAIATTQWYVNSELNANLTINAGSGDDTVETVGAGSWIVDLGSGDDVIYSDNSGATATTEDRAVWVLNTANQLGGDLPNASRSISNIVSDVDDSHALYGASLSITLNGYTFQTDVIDQYVTTDLELNNLIKGAIAGNDFLNKLIEVSDGPANSLVIRSLTDGDFASQDFTVSIADTAIEGTMTVSEIAAFDAVNGNADVYTTQSEVQDKVDADVALWTAATDYNTAMLHDSGTVLTGADSTAITASTITAGAGNDTIVLSTSGLGTETVYLGDDGDVDVVYNATNADIYGLDTTDVVVYSDGTSQTSFVDADFETDAAGNLYLEVRGTGPVVPPVPGTADISVTGAASYTADDTLAETFTITAGTTFTYSIAGFDTTEDLLDFGVTSASISIVNAAADGEATFTYTPDLGATEVTITLTGLTVAEDLALTGAAGLDAILV